MNLTKERNYILNLETSKIELHFSKEDYQALSLDEKKMLKSSFLFSPKAQAWVSRSKNNHYSAIATAEKLGFTSNGKTGKRLTFQEELELEAEKAENKSERFEQYADNATKRGQQLQGEFNEMKKDWSWITQPNISSSAGRSFTNQRNRIIARYEKGFDEYRKSEYYKERAETARATADQSKLQSKTYLNNRIEETKKAIRQLEKRTTNSENTDLLDRLEYEVDKLAYLHNCLDEIGGITYSKENIKPGYLVKIRGRHNVVVKTNPKTVEVKSSHATFSLKYNYADIQEVEIPENYKEIKKETPINPFKTGDVVTMTNIGGDRIIGAFQIIKTTPKSVVMQEINVEDNKPQLNSFKNDEQLRKTPRKSYNGTDVLAYQSWYLYKQL